MTTGQCDGCGGAHEATYHHEGQFNEGPIFVVTCPDDGLATWVTREGLTS